MARPSKTQQFAIYQDPDVDAGMPPPHDNAKTSTVEPRHSVVKDDWRDVVTAADYEDVDDPSENVILEETDEQIDVVDILSTQAEYEDLRRQSAVTSTSISSFPESSFETDVEQSLARYHTYESPGFKLPHHRKQMSSPSLFQRSPRCQTVYTRSRTGTPRSGKVSAKGSPLPRRRYNQDIVVQEPREYPLVLLHVTLLPVQLRWSTESMQELLPSTILEGLHQLRSMVSDTVAQRGILIPHPKEEYELLEERLLEALELKKERITKCGHFRARDSTSSSSSAEGSVQSSDSGIGSSIVGDNCDTCHRRIKSTEIAVGPKKQKWSIKVFAANGLMRASAWAAAWSEMERVDVEILPWIDEDLRKQLDARLVEEEAAARYEVEEARMREAVVEEMQVEHERAKHTNRVAPEDSQFHDIREELFTSTNQVLDEEQQVRTHPVVQDLPTIYRSKDIPLSLLLKNYVLLLVQDSRNIGILCLCVLVGLLALRASVAVGPIGESIQSSSKNALAQQSHATLSQAMLEETTLPKFHPLASIGETASAKEELQVPSPNNSRETPVVATSRAAESSNAGHTLADPGRFNRLVPDTSQDHAAPGPHRIVPAAARQAELARCDNALRPSRIFEAS